MYFSPTDLEPNVCISGIFVQQNGESNTHKKRKKGEFGPWFSVFLFFSFRVASD